MSSKLINGLKYLLFLLLGVFLLWLSFRQLDLSEVWADILKANYIWMFIALVFAVFSHIFRALRWNLLINSMGYQTKLMTTFYAVMVGYMANTAVPRMGEFMRCGMLARKGKIPFNALIGSVISERVFDLLVLLILLFSVVVFQWDLAGGFVTRMIGPLLESVMNNFNLLLIVSITGVLSIAALLALALMFKDRIKGLPGYGKTREIIVGLIAGAKTIKHVKQKGLFLLYTFLIWLFYAMMIYLPFFMLPETAHLDFMAAVTFLVIGSLGIVAPVPGGIGAYHFIGKATLVELYGISGTIAGSFVAITHAGQTLLNVGVGAIGYFLLTFTKRKKQQDEQN